MTHAEYARHRGYSRARVTQLVKAGRIITTQEGLVDSDRSDTLLESRERNRGTKFITPGVKAIKPKETKQPKPKVLKSNKPKAEQRKIEQPKAKEPQKKVASPPPLKVISPGPPPPPRDRMTYDKARTAKMAMEAKLKEIELKQKQGALISKDIVEKQAFELGRKVRDAFLNIPGRIGPILAAEMNQQKVHALLLKEIEAVLEMLAGNKG